MRTFALLVAVFVMSLSSVSSLTYDGTVLIRRPLRARTALVSSVVSHEARALAYRAVSPVYGGLNRVCIHTALFAPRIENRQRITRGLSANATRTPTRM